MISKTSIPTASLIVSGMTLIIVSISAFVFTPLSIKNALNDIESQKVGGDSNYAVMQEIFESEQFKSSQKTSLENARKQMLGATPTQPKADEQIDNTNPGTTTKISMEQVSAIKKDAYIVGDTKAKILIIEYSDLQCPFCRKHFESKTLETLITKYQGTVAKTMRHFPLSNHPYAAKAGEGAECFAQGSTEKYLSFVGAVFAKDLNRNGTNQTIYDINKELGGNETTFKNCVDSGTYTKKVQDQLEEGSTLFGVSGTPGNVILNTENGEFILLAGVYPAEEFEKIIAKRLP